MPACMAISHHTNQPVGRFVKQAGGAPLANQLAKEFVRILQHGSELRDEVNEYVLSCGDWLQECAFWLCDNRFRKYSETVGLRI